MLCNLQGCKAKYYLILSIQSYCILLLSTLHADKVNESCLDPVYNRNQTHFFTENNTFNILITADL
jgi:hypothetical protein